MSVKMSNEQEIDRFSHFLKVQNQFWKLSEANYLGLDRVMEKTFVMDGFQIKVQYNPERMRSSAAKVDQASIAARSCFLCRENRPAEQNSLPMSDDFLLLVNPFPIFRTHFTLPSIHHTPQLLLENLKSLLFMAKEMEGYTLFYNGPECGASAPDHLHFQAGENGFLPIESEFERMKEVPGTCLVSSDNIKIWAFDHYLRSVISIETTDWIAGVREIRSLLLAFQELQPDKLEPMINLLCLFREDQWQIHLFPRKTHRPSQFFEKQAKQLLISPASVDLGGVFITPRLEDFEKITPADIRDIFRQITVDEATFLLIKEKIRNNQ